MALVDKIKSASDLKSVTLDVPEWGTVLTLKSMTAGERDQFESSCYDQATRAAILVDWKIKLAIYSVCNEDGERMFTESDIPWLRTKSSAAFDRIADAALRLNKFSAADIEELEKN